MDSNISLIELCSQQIQEYRNLCRAVSSIAGGVIYQKAGKESPVPEFHNMEEVKKLLEVETRTWKEEWQAESRMQTLAACTKALMESLGTMRERALDLLKISAEDRAKLDAFEQGPKTRRARRKARPGLSAGACRA